MKLGFGSFLFPPPTPEQAARDALYSRVLSDTRSKIIFWNGGTASGSYYGVTKVQYGRGRFPRLYIRAKCREVALELTEAQEIELDDAVREATVVSAVDMLAMIQPPEQGNLDV